MPTDNHENRPELLSHSAITLGASVESDHIAEPATNVASECQDFWLNPWALAELG